MLYENYIMLNTVYGRNIFSKYKIISLLKPGQNDIFLAKDKQGKQFAIKEIIQDHDQLNSLIQEIERHKMSDHPKVIKVIDACILEKDVSEYQRQILGYIVLEKGLFDLEKYKINGNKIPLCVIDQLLDVFTSMQSIGITHMDIKPQNVLVTALDPFIVKICDFGVSKTNSSIIYPIGTALYMSPEMINCTVRDYEKSDVYSCGLLFLYLYKDRRIQLNQRQYQLDIRETDKISLLCDKMLQLRPDDRFKFSELLSYWKKLNLPEIKRIRQISLTSKKLLSPTKSRGQSIYEITNKYQSYNSSPSKTTRFGQIKLQKLK